MTRLRGSWVAVAAVALFLLSACARTGDPGAAPSESAAPGGSPSADSDALVLRIDRVGGFVAPDQQVGRYPVVSVYADGRVITTGPQIQIYPGPALPNLLVQQVDEATLQGLLDKAAQAGVRSGADLGRPSVADAPTTRITVATPGGGSSSLEAVALTEAQPDDPRLTPAQREARAKLATFVQEVSDLPTAEGMPKAQPYRPVAVAALARPYTDPQDGLPKKPVTVAWPGPDLPGEPLNAQTGCVTATGTQAQQVLAAAKQANQITPWTSGGRRWTVTLRPLLPDESGCANLKGAR